MRRCGRAAWRTAIAFAGLLAWGCGGGGAPPGPRPPTDPAALTFAEDLGIDLADFERTRSGLYIQDITVGVGAMARRTSRVWITYAGWLPDGTLFDSNVGGEPFHFRMGGSEVIRGWNEGIQGMKVGGRRRLVVRPGLGYGSRGKGKVPAGATIVFELQLIDVR
jgi:FKBP-type peptidyl-prolyl cis-trans isomerase FkpA